VSDAVAGARRALTLWRLFRREQTESVAFYRHLAAEAAADLDRRHGRSTRSISAIDDRPARERTRRVVRAPPRPAAQEPLRRRALGAAHRPHPEAVRARPGLEIERVEPRYGPRLAFLCRIPGPRELVTWNCVIRVSRRHMAG
jgi:hypothetical protein